MGIDTGCFESPPTSICKTLGASYVDMKKIILSIILSFSFGASFGQLDTNEILEPVAYARACLQVATNPPPDTVDCYPSATKRWLVLIDQYVKDLSKKLNPDARKGLEAANQVWLEKIDKELQETNQIIQDKNLPLLTRRQAAIRQFQFAEKRALNLRRAIAST